MDNQDRAQRKRTEASHQLRSLRDAIERLAIIIKEIDGDVTLLVSLSETSIGSRDVTIEYFEDLSTRIERIERALQLLLARRAYVEDEERAIHSDLELQGRKSSLKKQLRQYSRNLSRLQEQRAKFGGLLPTSLQNEIEGTKGKIATIQEELKQ